MVRFTDEILEKKIDGLKTAIETWAKKHGVWYDSNFASYLEHTNDEPEELPVVLVLHSGGGLVKVLDYESEFSDEFLALIESTEFYFDMYYGTTAFFYPKAEELIKPYYDYFEWKWICSLIQPNYSELYEEVFHRIQNEPKKLHDLTPRQLEIFIHEIFKNQGYDTELGKGMSDGGIDLRLYQKDEIDQITTLVQIKRYRPNLPIRLDAVAALSAHVEEEKANRGLFITTSRYLPGVKKFANRQYNRLILADKNEIFKWSNNAATRIIKDKSTLVTDQYLIDLINKKNCNGLVGKIVHASIGYNTVRNTFGLILKETVNACLIIKINSKAIKYFDSPYNFRGEEVPNLSKDIIVNRTKENVFRAKISINEYGQYKFWGQKHLYSVWDGKPKYFDFVD